MSTINVGLFGTANITQSETDTVSFLGAGTLNITGTAQNPITVGLSQVGGVAALDTINITNANVTLGGAAGVTALVSYDIGTNSSLTLASTLGVAAGTTIGFASSNSRLVLDSGLNLALLGSGISGFVPGDSIDLATPVASVSYADNAGSGTGGTLTLRDAGGGTVGTLVLTTGEYATSDFSLAADGTSGTLVNLGVNMTGATASPGTADLNAGHVVTITLGTAAPVTVSNGTPTLLLNDGGVATFNAAASAAGTLVFNYVVSAGQNIADLAITGFALNGSTIADVHGVPLVTSQAAQNPAGTLQVDTIAPTVTALSTNPGSGSVHTGDTVVFDFTMSENVAVTGGTPTLTLNDGGVATFVAGSSTPTQLVFDYLVGSGDSTPDLAVTAVNLNGATVADPAGNGASLSNGVGNPAGILSVNDGSSPTSSSNVIGVYRFLDTTTGTHFFTDSVAEKNGLINPSSSTYRPDLRLETNDFGGVDPSANDPAKIQVYRFFSSGDGTHFFTSNQAEAQSLMDPTSKAYRPDLVAEPTSSFYEDSTQQAGDVAVYRFFDNVHGTHFYTGSATEVAAITTPGAASYRPDLISEGVSFYAPSGSFS